MTNEKNKTVIVVAGPTAVGKTNAAIALAKHFQTEIISADSRQCFIELNIGVSRPTDDQLKEIKHHFIAIQSIDDDVNAAVFEKYALQTVDNLLHTHDTVIMTGGTGLYIKAFCQGLDDMPVIDPAVREKIISDYKTSGLKWLQQQIQQKDPAYFQTGETQNPQRMMRALEVMQSTGHSIFHFQKSKKAARPFNIIKIGLELPKQDLYRNINTRVDTMIRNGLLNEVKSLIGYKNLNALQTVGYAEIFDYFDQNISLINAIELIKQNTRQYAKRQMTWFKKDKEVKWFKPDEIEKMISEIQLFRQR